MQKINQTPKSLIPTILLIIGIIIFLLGAYQGGQYEEAKMSGYKIDATIVEVIEREETDADLSNQYTTYTVYADYIVNGQSYSHVKIGKYTEPKFVGDIIEIVVNPRNPGKEMPEGGFFALLGSALIAISVAQKVKSRGNCTRK